MPIETEPSERTAERSIEASLGNPLKDAIAKMSAGLDVEETDDNEEVEETPVVEDTDETEDTSEESKDEAKPEESDEDPEEKEETEDEEAEKPEGKKPKLASLDIPMPNADGAKGPRGTGKIKLEGVPQEAADAMRHYIKQADRLPLVEQQLEVAQEGAQIANFIERDPYSAIVMIGNAVPEAVDEFVKTYLQMNPTKVAQFTEELELGDMTERELKLNAKNAKREADERAVKSYQSHAGQFASQKQADSLLILAQNLAQTANVPEDEMDDFMFSASRRVAKLYKANPHITQREVVAALQPVVMKYAKAPDPVAPKAKGSAKVFNAKVEKAKKFAVIGSGKPAMKPAGSVTRPPKGTTTAQAIKMLAAGKLG